MNVSTLSYHIGQALNTFGPNMNRSSDICELFTASLTSMLGKNYLINGSNKNRTGWWFGTFLFSIIHGMSSFPMTIRHIFQRGRSTANHAENMSMYFLNCFKHKHRSRWWLYILCHLFFGAEKITSYWRSMIFNRGTVRVTGCHWKYFTLW